MEIYYYGSNGEKIGPVTKESLSQLVGSGVIVESTKLLVNGKQYIAGQVPTIAQLINRRKTSQNGPQSPPMSGDRQTSNSHEQASKPNSFARKIGHLYGAASSHGFVPKLKNLNIPEEAEETIIPEKSVKNSSRSTKDPKQKKVIITSKPVNTEFWNQIHIVTVLLGCTFVVSLVVLVLRFGLRLIQLINLLSEEYAYLSDMLEAGNRIDACMYDGINCIVGIVILCVVYQYLRLLNLYMASRIQSTEKAQEPRQTLNN